MPIPTLGNLTGSPMVFSNQHNIPTIPTTPPSPTIECPEFSQDVLLKLCLGSYDWASAWKQDDQMGPYPDAHWYLLLCLDTPHSYYIHFTSSFPLTPSSHLYLANHSVYLLHSKSPQVYQGRSTACIFLLLNSMKLGR